MSKKVVLEIANMGSRYGIETFNMNVLRNLDHSIVQLDFLSLLEGPFDEEIQYYGGRIFRISSLKNIKKHFKELKVLLCKHPEITTVHIHGNSAIGCLDALVAQKARIPQIIIHSHNDSCNGMRQKMLHYISKQLIKNVATLKLCCSDAAGQWMFGKNADYHVIPNAINLQQFIYSESKAKSNKKKYNLKGYKIIGHVGRMEVQKNHKFIIDVFDQIYRKHPDVRLLLVGDGSLRSEVEEIIYSKGLKKVVTIIRNSSDVAELLQMMDLFLFPSLWEGLGISLVEAQASGLPCVVSDAIKEEVCVTPLVCKLPLCNGAAFWAEIVWQELEKEKQRQSSKYIDALDEAGYNIVHLAKKMQTVYCEGKW